MTFSRRSSRVVRAFLDLGDEIWAGDSEGALRRPIATGHPIELLRDWWFDSRIVKALKSLGRQGTAAFSRREEAMSDRSTIEWTEATWNPGEGPAGCSGSDRSIGPYRDLLPAASRFGEPEPAPRNSFTIPEFSSVIPDFGAD